jgi:hypothetical protein
MGWAMNSAPWFESPIVDWWTMESFAADHFVGIGRYLGFMECNDTYKDGEKVSYPAGSLLFNFLEKIKNECSSIGLEISALKVDWILTRQEMTVVKFKTAISELHQRIMDEMGLTTFLHIPRENSRYYNPTEPLFSQAVSDKFPGAQYDVSEAGKCLACQRSTAAVFHTMRVVEAGLKETASVFDVEYMPSWEAYISAINKAKDALDRKDEASRKKIKYAEGILVYVVTIKNAWRNPGMHMEEIYTQEEAEHILKSAKLLMKKISGGWEAGNDKKAEE